MARSLSFSFFVFLWSSPASAANTSNAIGQTLLGLVIVTVTILSLAALAKRLGGSRLVGARSDFQIVGSLPVGVREKILTLKVGDELLVIGATSHSITLLHHLPADTHSQNADQQAKPGSAMPVQIASSSVSSSTSQNFSHVIAQWLTSKKIPQS